MPPLSHGQLLHTRLLKGHSHFSRRPLTSLSHQLIPNHQILLFPTDLPLAGLLPSASSSCQALAFLFSQSPTLLAFSSSFKTIVKGVLWLGHFTFIFTGWTHPVLYRKNLVCPGIGSKSLCDLSLSFSPCLPSSIPWFYSLVTVVKSMEAPVVIERVRPTMSYLQTQQVTSEHCPKGYTTEASIKAACHPLFL